MLHIHSILNGVFCIEQDTALNYMPLISSWLRGEQAHTKIQNKSKEERESSLMHDGVSCAVKNSTIYEIWEYGNASAPENAPTDSVALIYITGGITKYDQECGPSGMLSKSNILKRCYSNSNIKAVVLVTDSGGGEARAWKLMSDTINKKNKPVVGFITGMAASAAYGFISACDMIIAESNMDRVGSIGTYCTILDYSEWCKANGILLKDVYATLSTEKNSAFIESIKGNDKPLREQIDIINNDFIETVASNRGEKLTSDREKWNKGQCPYADVALELGLIDGIDNLENVINYFNT